MTRRIVAGIVASCAVIVGSWVDGANNTDHEHAQRCADRLGIRWTPADGVTERLDAFRECMTDG